VALETIPIPNNKEIARSIPPTILLGLFEFMFKTSEVGDYCKYQAARLTSTTLLTLRVKGISEVAVEYEIVQEQFRMGDSDVGIWSIHCRRE